MGQRIPTVIKKFLDEKTALYNSASFVVSDPVSIPHLFTRKEDIEIAGFLAATIAWGRRPTILKNARNLMHRMDDRPFEFILNFATKDLKSFSTFIHRTYNGNDCIYYLRALKHIYKNHGG